MKRCVIVGGADIHHYHHIKAKLTDNDYVIYCDSGLKHMRKLGKKADLIVGDFDSYDDPKLPVETITLPTVKDDTDTVYAVKEALRRHFEDFLLIGVIGGRLDHTLGNVSILLKLDALNKTAVIIDDYSEISVVSRRPAEIEDSFAFFSLINIDGSPKGITIQNAKYELDHDEIPCDYQYGVSNEVIAGKTATVTIDEGRLLLIKDYSLG